MLYLSSSKTFTLHPQGLHSRTDLIKYMICKQSKPFHHLKEQRRRFSCRSVEKASFLIISFTSKSLQIFTINRKLWHVLQTFDKHLPCCAAFTHVFSVHLQSRLIGSVQSSSATILHHGLHVICSWTDALNVPPQQWTYCDTAHFLCLALCLYSKRHRSPLLWPVCT